MILMEVCILNIRKMTRNARAFVFLETALGKEEDIMKHLLPFEEVKEVHIIAGEKDVLVVLEVKSEILAQNSQIVADFVRKNIARLSHVKDTETIIPHQSKTKWSA